MVPHRLGDALVVRRHDARVQALRLARVVVDVHHQRLSPQQRQGLAGESSARVTRGNDAEDARLRSIRTGRDGQDRPNVHARSSERGREGRYARRHRAAAPLGAPGAQKARGQKKVHKMDATGAERASAGATGDVPWVSRAWCGYPRRNRRDPVRSRRRIPSRGRVCRAAGCGVNSADISLRHGTRAPKFSRSVGANSAATRAHPPRSSHTPTRLAHDRRRRALIAARSECSSELTPSATIHGRDGGDTSGTRAAPNASSEIF